MDTIFSIGHKLFYFIVLISVLVVVHEWGHFIVARWCRVRVEAFSLFFGKVLWKKVWRGTEWRLSAIPFGGYVKMLGQSDLGGDQSEEMYREKAVEDIVGKPHDQVTEDEIAAIAPEAITAKIAELKTVSFAHKPLLQRAAIVFAGPLMNFVLAVVIFSLMYVGGYPTVTSRIGDVSDDSAAARAGLRAGDRVVGIDGREIWRWDDMAEIVETSPEKTLVFDIERGDERLSLTVTPEAGRKTNLFQFEVDAGILGIAPSGYLPIVGVADPASPAATAGLRTGDLVVQIDGAKVGSFPDIERLLSKASGAASVTVERGGLAIEEGERKGETMTFSLPTAAGANLASLGIERGDLFILETVPKSAAELAGLKPGDRILELSGEPVGSWAAFSKVVKASPEKPLALAVLRDGARVETTITPERVEDRDIMGELVAFGRVGVYPWISHAPEDMADERYLNPFKALARGFETTLHWSVLTIQGFAYLLNGTVSVKSLGGPIMIADLAGRSASVGLFSFVFTIAILSINLAILNLLPIPVLDGGHLMIFTVEGLIRRRLPETGLRWVTNFGLILVGGLMLTVIFNDVARIFPALRTLFGLLD